MTKPDKPLRDKLAQALEAMRADTDAIAIAVDCMPSSSAVDGRRATIASAVVRLRRRYDYLATLARDTDP